MTSSAESQMGGSFVVIDADYRRMVESIADYAIFLLDPKGIILTWNAGAQKINGYSAEEIIGRSFSVFYSQLLIDRQYPEYMLDMAAREGRFEEEGWRLRKDGSQFWAHITITRLNDEHGNLRGFSKITRDLNDRRHQADLLQHSEERFRLLVESVQDYAIFMLDPDGNVASWNIGAELNKGYKAHEIIGKHFSVFYPSEAVANGVPTRALATALSEGHFKDIGWRVRKDGTRFWASVVITALRDATGIHRGFAKVTRDMTQSLRVNALEDEGRRITNFLAMLGHELRNPLAPIANAVSIMAGDDVGSEHWRTLRDLIARQVGQMARLIDNLLDVGRITSGKVHLDMQPLRLRDAVMDAIESVEPLIHNKAHALATAMDGDELWAMADRTRIVQIIANLLSNAAKFTPSSGAIQVAIARVGAVAEISVKDNGIGISEELLPHIFKLFFQGEQDAARSHGGLGLGLSLVHELALLHGGRVSAYSGGEGAGAEFIIQLPLIEPPLRQENFPPAELVTAAQKKLLIVDDNADAADTMAVLLNHLGYHTTVAYDGEAAVEIVHEDAFDAVLLDIGLPGLTGIEVAERLHSDMPAPPPLIAITGYGQESERQRSFAAGFKAHLTKPVNIAELMGLLNKLTL